MGSFGIKINTIENKTLHYSVISPHDYRENKYIFGSMDSKKEYLWHEISHLTINGLTEKYIGQFDTGERKASKVFVDNFYTSIETIINEYIIRAITIRLFEMNGQNDFVKRLIQDNIQKGFVEIELIKNYLMENCEEENKLQKEERYKKLMEYVIGKL
jgi:hypothetical protein